MGNIEEKVIYACDLGIYYNSYFAISQGFSSSTTTASIKIFADDEKVYHSGDIISASTDIPAFHIPVNGIN